MKFTPQKAFISSKGAILLALQQGPCCGRDLIRRIETLTNGQLQILEASLYPTLHGFVSAGLVKSVVKPARPRRGGRPRKIYELTVNGHEQAETLATILEGLL